MASNQPHTDLARVVPELVELRTFAEAGDWSSVVDRFIGLLNRDEALLPAASEVITHTNAEMVRMQHERDPSNLVSKALRAHERIVTGWSIRSGARASQVSAEQFAAFHQHLREAEQLLIELCAVEPEWSLPWYLRLLTARGLELGGVETRRRYDRLAEHHPDHFSAQQQLLQQLCPKWSGTWEQAFGFVRESAAAAPPGSAAPALLPIVLLEQWLDEDDTKAATRALKRPEVRDELVAASGASVFHPEFRAGFGWVTAHTAFGLVHALAGDADLAGPHFRVLGEVVDGTLWGYLGKDSDPVNKIRRDALATAGAR